MDKEEAKTEIETKKKKALELLRECEVLADNHDVIFSFGGPTYGMGGRYCPKNRDNLEGDYDEYENKLGWLASSHEQC